MDRFREPKVMVVAVVVAVALVVVVSRCSQRPDSSGQTASVTVRSPVTSTVPSSTSSTGFSTSTSTVTANDDIDGHGHNTEFDRDPTNPADAWWLNLFLGVPSPVTQTERVRAWSEPSNSDLGAVTASEVAALGEAVLKAHLTGQGRDRWPQYFASVPPRSAPATGLEIHGAAAAKAGGVGDGWVRVAVLWTATVPPDTQPTTMFSEFLFAQDSAGVWQPRQCWDTGKTTSCELNVLAAKPLP